MSPSALFVTTVPITLEVFLAPFAEHFRASGWRVDALANGATGVEALAAAFDRRFDIAWSRNPFSPSNLIGAAGRVRRIVADGGYDIVHVHTPIAAFVTRYALRSLPAASRPVVIYTAHGFHFYEGGPALTNAVFRATERAAAAWTDLLVTINAEDHAAALALGTLPAERIRLIPGIGVDVDRFSAGSVDPSSRQAVREGLDVAPDRFLLTMVAEFAPVKRHAHLLDAFARTDGSVVLALVGEGPLEARLRARVDELGLASRVRFAGYRRDIPAILAASDATTLVSEREGLARSVLEAMAAGRPVIGTRTRGIADLIDDEVGWLVDKHDVAQLAAAIDAAAADPDEARRRGEAAARRVMEYALDAVISDYEDLYREALDRRV